MTNIFAFRDTNPNNMKKEESPIGDENDEILVSLSKSSGIVIAAWGIHGSHKNRDKEVRNLVSPLHCLGVTKDGFPKHPLYLKKDSKPILLDKH